jgi:hypothetical protein
MPAAFDPFDPTNLALSPEQLATISIVKVSRPSRPGKKDPFVYRVPLNWLTAAGRLPHRALQVGVLLWFESGRRRNRTITFCLARGGAMGLSEDTTRRALHRLEAAGLASIIRKPGRGLAVTLLDAPATGEEETP